MKKSILYIVFITLSLIISSCVQTEEKKDYVKKVVLNEETIAVGIYKATGYEYPHANYIAEAINIDGGIVYVTLSDADVLKTKLDNIDVLIFPALGEGQTIDVIDQEIEEIFRKFISKKGAIGFSNGCRILIECIDSQSFNLVDNGEINEAEFFSGIANFQLSDKGNSIFPDLADKQNLMLGMNNKFQIDIMDTTNVDVIVSKVDSQARPLFVTTKLDKGKIFIANAQPETTPGMRWMIPRMVRWVYNKEFIYYNENVFRPNLFPNEISLDEDLNSKLDDLIKILDTGNESEIIYVMGELQNLYPLIAAEKVRTLLIEKNNNIKLKAAEYLVFIEYTSVIEDLRKVIKGERSKKVKAQLEGFLIELENMLEQN